MGSNPEPTPAAHQNGNGTNGTKTQKPYPLPHPDGMAAYAAPSLFQPHRARQALRDAADGKIPPMMVCYFGLSSIPMARFLAPFGFDAVWIDWEHSACGVETMTTVCPLPPPSCRERCANRVQMVHEISFMSGGRTIPFVRYVPAPNPFPNPS